MNYHKINRTIVLSLISSSIASALPEGWVIKEFAKPPEVEYPTAISAAANGDIYISVDKNGSLGKNPEFGKIVRAKDTDGDGKADSFQDFVPHVNSPRGGHYVGDTLFLIHPPYLSSFRDTNGDGVADEKKQLVKGFGWGIEHPRGADHTTNAVRMGIDGWLYVAVGDFGMPDAVGADGKHVTLWGGGVARVRPDGSELEIFSSNVRNICDIAITPTLDMFSRDNTNDGKGWNTRFHHFVPMGDHGYPRLYQKFSNETVMALKDYGGGSGTGALALDEPGFPAAYKNAIFTCDWTTGNVYHHPKKLSEATFQIEQEVFHPLSRAVDIDVDGSSRLYVADWRNGQFSYEANKQVGMIQQILPPNWEKREFPDLKKMQDAELADHIGSESAVMRLEAQREMISRGAKEPFRAKLLILANHKEADVGKRVAAIFTYKQIFGDKSHAALSKLTADNSVSEFAIRALADRKSQLANLDTAIFTTGLTNENPRIRLQALNALARLDAKESAPVILKTMHGMNLDSGKITDTEHRIVPHVAVKALVSLGAEAAYLAAVSEGTGRALALRALQEIHSIAVVDGLVKIIESSSDPKLIEAILATLARLHYKEKAWDLNEWWSTRPDDRGPYFSPTEWEGTAKIRATLEAHFEKIAETSRNNMITLLANNRISISEIKLPGIDPVVLAISSLETNDSNLAILADAALDTKRDWQQRFLAFQTIDKAEPAKSIPLTIKTLAAWYENKEAAAELQISDFINNTRRILEIPILASIGKGGSDTESMIAWKALLTIWNSPLSKPHDKANISKILETNPMEVGLFLAIADMKISGFEQQIAAGINSDNDKTILAAKNAKEAGKASTGDTRKVGELKPEEITAIAMKEKGNVENGQRLYISQGCIACHAIDLKAAQKGPYLGASGAKFQRDYLIQSIINPNAIVAQGFQTNTLTMKDGKTYMGFITSEADDLIELRDIAGQVSKVKRSDVKEQHHIPQSMMPAGLANPLSVTEFSDLIEYLVSLKSVGG